MWAKDNQVLVKVQAASANVLDFRRFPSTSMVGRFMDGVLLKAINTVLGVDIAGRVEAVGAAVKQFQPGDEVFGVCKGAFAEYACADENELVLKPASLSFEAAAAVPVAAVTALQGLRDKGQIQSGQQVLINGASGGVGTFAVQLARSFGTEVTAVCSTQNVDMARSIGQTTSLITRKKISAEMDGCTGYMGHPFLHQEHMGVHEVHEEQGGGFSCREGCNSSLLPVAASAEQEARLFPQHGPP